MDAEDADALVKSAAWTRVYTYTFYRLEGLYQHSALLCWHSHTLYFILVFVRSHILVFIYLATSSIGQR